MHTVQQAAGAHAPAGREPVLETENLVKSYGEGEARFDALRGLTLQIGRGESVAIVGKSGSGKSTLMHLLALLDQPSHGVVAMDGRPVSELKPKAVAQLRNETFGFVFQQFFLNPSQTVLENAVLPLKIAGVPRAERRRRGLEVLERLELADGVVRRPSVHDDELEVGERLALEALDAAAHGLLGVMGRHENGDRWCCRRVMRHCPASFRPTRKTYESSRLLGYQRAWRRTAFRGPLAK